MNRSDSERVRCGFWSSVDSQAGAAVTSAAPWGWSVVRGETCIALRSDGQRCFESVPTGAGFCDLHFRKFLRWSTDHLVDEAVRQARSDDPEAFRFLIDRARLHDAMATLEEANQRVYFIACGDVVKVGFSKNPIARLAGIKQQRNAVSGRTLAPSDIDLAEAVIVGEIPGGQKVEQQIHTLLASYRVVGEWFRITPTVIAAIDCLVFGAEPPRTIEAGLRDMYSDEPGARRRRNRQAVA